MNTETTLPEIPYYHAILIRRLPATDTRGCRVVMECPTWGLKKTIPYNFQFNNVSDIALDYLTRAGLEIVGMTHRENSRPVFLMPARQGIVVELHKALA